MALAQAARQTGRRSATGCRNNALSQFISLSLSRCALLAQCCCWQCSARSLGACKTRARAQRKQQAEAEAEANTHTQAAVQLRSPLPARCRSARSMCARPAPVSSRWRNATAAAPPRTSESDGACAGARVAVVVVVVVVVAFGQWLGRGTGAGRPGSGLFLAQLRASWAPASSSAGERASERANGSALVRCAALLFTAQARRRAPSLTRRRFHLWPRRLAAAGPLSLARSLNRSLTHSLAGPLARPASCAIRAKYAGPPPPPCARLEAAELWAPPRSRVASFGRRAGKPARQGESRRRWRHVT